MNSSVVVTYLKCCVDSLGKLLHGHSNNIPINFLIREFEHLKQMQLTSHLKMFSPWCLEPEQGFTLCEG